MVYGFNYPYQYVQPTAEEVLKIFGVGLEYDDLLTNKTRALIADAEGFCNPVGGFNLFDSVVVHEDLIQIEGSSFSVGNQIGEEFMGADRASIMLCTAGSEITEWSEAHMPDDPNSAYIIDIIGSIVIEKTLQMLVGELKSFLNNSKLNVTLPFQPGYCGWDVEAQDLLLSFFPHAYCGVRPGGSFFLNPRKSLLALVGIGAGLLPQTEPCLACKSALCSYRLIHNEI